MLKEIIKISHQFMFLSSHKLNSDRLFLLTTFINGGAFCYFFVFMLIRPSRLTLVEIFFRILPLTVRLIGLISIKTKEY